MARLNSLGLGSDGVLSYDVIDQLRAVDESGQVKPVERKLTSNATKTTDLSLLTVMAASLKSSASILSDDMTYLTRSISNNGNSANVTVESGAAIQDFTLDVQNLALRDIYQSKSYTSQNSTFASSNDTLTLGIGSDSFNIDVTSSTSITELKDLINDNSDGKVIASILNVGGDNPYKLIIKSTDTGEDNAINFSSTGTAVSDLGLDTNTYEASLPTGSYGSADTLTFNINGTDHTLAVASTDTITEINSKILGLGLGNELTSSIENGKLVLNSSDSDISISGLSASTFGFDDLTKQTGNVQKASDSLFLYNGVSINRSSNNIDDLIVGVSISLQETGKTSVDISQNTKQISTSVSSFITNYNELMTNLSESVNYDSDSGNSGTFQGVSQIVSLKSTLSRNLMTPDNEGRNLANYGITLNSNGYLDIDSTVFDAKLSENSADVESFFTGHTSTDVREDNDGYFTKLNSTMSNFIDGDDSVLGLYELQLANEKKTLETQKTKAIASLDSKYEIMANRFAAYDSIISGLNSQFQVLDSMIQAQYADN